MGDDNDLLAHLAEKRKQVAAMQEAAAMAQQQTLAIVKLQRRVAEIDALAYGTSSDVQDEDEELRPSVMGGGGRPGPSSAPIAGSILSPEDRKRFGLDDTRELTPRRREVSALQEHASPSGSRRQREGAANGNRPRVWWGPEAEGEASTSPRTPRGDPLTVPSLGGAGGGIDMHLGGGPPLLGGGMPPQWSSLSLDDRRRFGLEEARPWGTPLSTAAAPLALAPQRPQQRRPPCSGQFGDQVEENGESLEGDAAGLIIHKFNPVERGMDPRLPRVQRLRPQEEPAELAWQKDKLVGASDAPLSTGVAAGMSRTLAQLQAAGCSVERLKALEETERQLQLLKSIG